jgi:hypothetical protein
LYRRLGGAQERSGQVRKISPPNGIRSPDRAARSQSLYRLSYPTHTERLSNAPKNQGRKRKRWNIDKLKNEEDLNLYQQKINEKLEDTDGIKDVQMEWN